MSEKRFPILLGPKQERESDYPTSVPWVRVEDCRWRAEKNHCGQTLERLAERGGLSPAELWCAAHDKPLFGHSYFETEHAPEVKAWLIRVAKAPT